MGDAGHAPEHKFALDLRRRAPARGAGRAATLLAVDPRVALVYLFGSVAQADRPTVGDIDLGFLADPPLSLDELLKRRAELVAAGCGPLDLVSLNEASIVLAREVADTGLCLFARTPDVEAEFVTRARARYWDFSHYREEQWRLAGERAAERGRGPATGSGS